MSYERRNIFENVPVLQAIIRLAIPTMIGQIILVLYNMADTFFIGITGSDAMLAAVTVCTPAFMFLSAISNLFGVGGASAIARALGRKDTDCAYDCSAFSFYGCLMVTAIYSLGVLCFLDNMINLLGGSNPEVHQFARVYMTITVVIGGLSTSMNALLAHLIRSEGRAMQASIGIALGGIFNIALYPLFMFVILPKGNELMGAAIATALSNTLALLYFVFILVHIRKQSVLRFRWKSQVLSGPIPGEIIRVGLPACMMTLCENISFSVMDALVAVHGLSYQAGLGVAKKVNMLAHCIVRGISQGVLPLIAYNYAAGQKKRMHDVIRSSLIIAVGMASLCTAISLFGARELISIFIHNASDSLDHGITYLRILCIGCPFSALAYILISVFQAVNFGGESLILALLRKGILDIPLLFVLNRALPPYGLAWATPGADFICAICAITLYELFKKQINRGTAVSLTDRIHDMAILKAFTRAQVR